MYTLQYLKSSYLVYPRCANDPKYIYSIFTLGVQVIKFEIIQVYEEPGGLVRERMGGDVARPRPPH